MKIENDKNTFNNKYVHISDKMGYTKKEKKYFKRLVVYEMMNGRCAYCGKKISLYEMTVDHIKPQSKNGPNTIDNMFCTCKKCNETKASKTVDSFKHQIMLVYRRMFDDHRDFSFYYEGIEVDKEKVFDKAVSKMRKHIKEKSQDHGFAQEFMRNLISGFSVY